MFAFSSQHSEVCDHSSLSESRVQSLPGCPETLHFCTCDGWVRCCNKAWLLLEVMVTGETQSIFNEGHFYRGLGCQDRDGAFSFLFDVEGQCRDTILFYNLFLFLIAKKVGAVSGTNINHFRYFGLGPKCNESGGCKCVYFYGQIPDEVGKSNLWPCTDGVRLACLSIHP